MLFYLCFCCVDVTNSIFNFVFQIDFEGDGGLEFPKAIPVASTPGDAGADNLKTKKIEGNMQTNNSIKDQTSNSISSSINRVSLEDSNGKESVLSRENTQSNLSSQPKSSKKPAARAKVPFEKGYSQMDWLKLTRTHPDLAGKLQLLLFLHLCMYDYYWMASVHLKTFLVNVLLLSEAL